MSYVAEATRVLNGPARCVEHKPSGDVEYQVAAPQRLGAVVVPTGRIVACEPLGMQMLPFTASVPSGTYLLQRIDVIVGMFDGSVTYPEVAALQLVVRDEAAARWEAAVVEGQDPADAERAGHAVDGGTTTLADAAALRALERWDDSRRIAAFHRPDVPEVVDVVVDEASGANVIAVRTGGDGVFTTLVGYAAYGAVTSFATICMTLPADPTDAAPRV
jgi:hypothetical protein